MAWPSQTNPGLFIGTTFVFDIGEIQQLDISPEFKDLLVRLYQNLNAMQIALNLKDSGYYAEEEFVNSQSYPPVDTVVGNAPTVSRQVFRKLIDFGPLPNTGTATVAHGISLTTAFSFTRIYGAASDQAGFNYIPIPYASPTDADNIELRVDTTNVIITTGSNRSNFTQTWIVLEYLKN